MPEPTLGGYSTQKIMKPLELGNPQALQRIVRFGKHDFFRCSPPAAVTRQPWISVDSDISDRNLKETKLDCTYAQPSPQRAAGGAHGGQTKHEKIGEQRVGFFPRCQSLEKYGAAHVVSTEFAELDGPPRRRTSVRHQMRIQCQPSKSRQSVRYHQHTGFQVLTH